MFVVVQFVFQSFKKIQQEKWGKKIDFYEEIPHDVHFLEQHVLTHLRFSREMKT